MSHTSKPSLSFDRNAPTLYLNPDGALHAGHLVRQNGQLRLDTHRPPFEFAELLANVFEPYPHVQIVLTLAWLYFSYPDEITRLLPRRLTRRFVTCACAVSPRYQDTRGGTSHPSSVLQHVERNAITNWVALHDGAYEISGDHANRFILIDPSSGFESEHVQRKLQTWLRTCGCAVQNCDVNDPV